MVTTKLAGLQLGPIVLWLVLLLLVRRGLGYRLAPGAEGMPSAIRV